MAYDAADGYVLAYGGASTSAWNVVTFETWKYAKNNWTLLSPTKPAGMKGGGSSGGQNMVYDPVDRYVVYEIGNYSAGASTVYTYTYHANTWKNISKAGAPPIRWRESFVWDPADRYGVLFGGCRDSNCNSQYNDTWTFAGGNWTNRTRAVAPSPRERTMMAYDPSDGYVLLFGGTTGVGGVDYNDTWSFLAGTWTQRFPTTAPAPRDAAPAATYVNAVLLFGGEAVGASYLFNDTWAYSNGNWTNETQSVYNRSAKGASPPYRCCTMMSYDGSDHGVLFFGGWDAFEQNGTWLLEGSLRGNATAVPSATDVGDPVVFNATAVGGVPPYTYAWALQNGAAINTSENPTATYATAGTYRVEAWINDSANSSVNFLVPVLVADPPHALSISSTPSVADKGVLVAFRGNFTGGTTPFAYRWDFGDGNGSNLTMPSHAFPNAGSYTIGLRVTDAVGNATNSTLTLLVAPNETASFSRDRPVADVGQTVNFSASAGAGTAPYNFSWAFGDGGRAFGGRVVHGFASPGNHTVALWVNDSGGGSLRGNLTVAVNSDPSVRLDLTSAVGEVGVPLALAANGTGGTLPYRFTWTFGDGTNGSGAPTHHAYRTPGVRNVTLRLVDATGTGARTTGPVRIVAAIAISITNSPAVAYRGGRVTVTPTVTGGAAPYSINVSFGDGNFTRLGAAGPVIYTYGSTGTFALLAAVTDGLGGVNRSNASVQVDEALAARIVPSTGHITLGQSVRVAESTTGGVPPLAYAWPSLPADCLPGSSSAIACVPGADGTATFVGQVSDADGEVVRSTVQVSVAPALHPAFRAGAPYETAGCGSPYRVNFTGSAEGGYGGYAFGWTFGAGATPAGASSAVASVEFAQSGSYPVQLTVTDGDNASASTNVTVQVPSDPCAPPGPSVSGIGGLTSLDLALVGAVVLLAGAVVFAIVRRRPGAPSLPPASDQDPAAPEPGSPALDHPEEP